MEYATIESMVMYEERFYNIIPFGHRGGGAVGRLGVRIPAATDLSQ